MTAGMHCRAAEEADAAAIAALFARSFAETFGHLYRAEDLRNFLAARGAEAFRAQLADPRIAFRIARDGEELAGFAKLGPPTLPVQTPPDTLELSLLYVDSRSHGRGVAAALMEWVLESARLKGARQLQLGVYVDNHRARRFYERYGFTTVGRYDFKVGGHTDEDLVLRHLVLQAGR